MPAISLKAHYDGTTIRLDEPYELPRDAQLLVTVLSPTASDDKRATWGMLVAEALTRAYGDEEPEYSSADIVP